MRNPHTICEIRLHLRIAHTNFADSTYILQNPLTVAEFRTNSYICLLRNPQQNKYADKIYVTGICMRNQLKFCITSFETCLWYPGTYTHKNVLLSCAQFGLVMLCASFFCDKLVTVPLALT